MSVIVSENKPPRRLSKTPSRVFVDATYTLSSGKNSGIERVVRNIIAQWTGFGHRGLIPKPTVVVSHGGKFYPATEGYLRECKRVGRLRAGMLANMPPAYRLLSEWICRTSKSARLRKWLLPQKGHLGIFKLPYAIREATVRRFILGTQRPLTFAPGDLLLLPDAYWISRLRQSVWPAAGQARHEGAFVATLLYDLIPITHPEFVGQRRSTSFDDYLKKMAEHSDLLIAISRAVRDQARDYLNNRRFDQVSQIAENDEVSVHHPHTVNSAPKGNLPPKGQRPIEIRAFKLGAELNAKEGEPREHVRRAFSGDQTPYLMVATFDPRKNHTYLLDAFDAMWQTGATTKLCLVGRIGSRCDDVVRRILNHPLLERQLFLLDDLSDAELHYCYRQCRGVIFPSVVEGFGLPIVEALWFGKKTFASDTPIHREVGGAACSYFDLSSPSTLIEQIQAGEQQLAEQPDAASIAQQPGRWRPTSWRESAEELLGHCLQMQHAARQAAFPNGSTAAPSTVAPDPHSIGRLRQCHRAQSN